MQIQMRLRWTSLRSAGALVLSVATIAITARYMTAQAPAPDRDYRAFLKTEAQSLQDGSQLLR
jgi:hypothetical protein